MNPWLAPCDECSREYVGWDVNTRCPVCGADRPESVLPLA